MVVFIKWHIESYYYCVYLKGRGFLNRVFLDCSSGKGWCKDWQPSCQQYPLDRMYLGLICGVVGVGGGVGGIGNGGPDLGVKGN